MGAQNSVARGADAHDRLFRRHVESRVLTHPARRRFLAGLAAAVVAAAPSNGRAAGSQRRVWTSLDNAYFAYPHANGFVSDHQLILTQQAPERSALRYGVWDFLDGGVEPMFETSDADMYGDYCEATRSFYFRPRRRQLREFRLGEGARPRVVVEPALAANAKMEPLVSVDPQGEKALWAIEAIDPANHEVRAARLMETTLATGETRELAALAFNADHQHYCPADPSWIGFSHEGDVRDSLDRMWAVHIDAKAATVERIWDERDASGVGLNAGHERWCFHAAAALVVAYGAAAGRGGAAGLYLIDAATRRAKLMSASPQDWHCNISRDGRMAVVDTRARRQDDGPAVSTVELVDMKSGGRTPLATAHAKDHPWHPHPHISPSGRYVVFNDFGAQGTPPRVKVIEIG